MVLDLSVLYTPKKGRKKVADMQKENQGGRPVLTGEEDRDITRGDTARRVRRPILGWRRNHFSKNQ